MKKKSIEYLKDILTIPLFESLIGSNRNGYKAMAFHSITFSPKHSSHK
jgi:hypothetical protein